MLVAARELEVGQMAKSDPEDDYREVVFVLDDKKAGEVELQLRGQDKVTIPRDHSVQVQW